MNHIASAPDAKLIRAIADRLIEHRFQGWFYGDSIGFEGLMAASALLDRDQYRDFTHGFFRAWGTRRTPFLPDDNTAPGHIMCELIERSGDAVLKEATLDLARHLRDRRKVNGVSITFEDTRRSLLKPYGEVAQTAEEDALLADPGAGIYLDCMHFDPPFFAHLSRIDPQGGWSERAIDEILGYRDLLFDAETGLYCHFWLEKTRRPYTRGWGRGQGWALLGLVDVIHYADPATPGYDRVAEQARGLAEVMRGYQLADGNWHSLVHEPRSGPESSTAAFMATAFYRGMALGLLDPADFADSADRAFAAMLGNLDDQGNLMGVTAAVYSALVEEHYWYIPTNQIVPWGQGPALTAMAARKAWTSENR